MFNRLHKWKLNNKLTVTMLSKKLWVKIHFETKQGDYKTTSYGFAYAERSDNTLLCGYTSYEEPNNKNGKFIKKWIPKNKVDIL